MDTKERLRKLKESLATMSVTDMLVVRSEIVNKMENPEGDHYITRIGNACEYVPDISIIDDALETWLIENMPLDVLRDAFIEKACMEQDFILPGGTIQ